MGVKSESYSREVKTYYLYHRDVFVRTGLLTKYEADMKNYAFGLNGVDKKWYCRLW